MFSTLDEIIGWVAAAPRPWLFLDYDGTLADFPASPDTVQVRPGVIRLVQQLASHPRLRVTVISGRKLQDLRVLLPVKGVFLAGVYGLEIQTPAGDVIQRVKYGLIRPSLDRVKLHWGKLIAGRADFFLEDKGWSLALHVQSLDENLPLEVITTARRIAVDDLPDGRFRLFVDRNFLEIAPLQAHKGETVDYLFREFPLPGARPVFIGDDDKDVEAIETVHTLGGIELLVSDPSYPIDSHMADYVLKSPRSVRRLLTNLLHLEQGPDG